ncbi:heterokaryon incompatibility protein-domain-containing protein [Sordaria brevicollis]|uniref:Heterokaryon incompatibility protein-domain-containing protein n=1 Tax=Sordaria brevicollis TaxID=83679 RepID=A0AAE0UEN7_SORBR|nr:heterokaryon incompatibility protein-domain-containing protein [Sordaria brevicollis]
MFKSLGEAYEDSRHLLYDHYRDEVPDHYRNEVPFGTWSTLLASASNGDCHFCCSLVARALVSENAHLITGHRLNVSENSYPSLQPVVSEDGLFKMGINPAIDITTATRADKELILRLSIDYFDPKLRSFFFNLDIIGQDGERVMLASQSGNVQCYGFPASLNTGSEASLNQVLRWVDECRSNHLCGYAKYEEFHGRYPARFIDVGSVGSLTAKIRETTKMDLRELKYTTLSHCWGKSVPARLLLDNYDSRLKGFTLDELPRTFHEAILVTRKLNIRFLWIDSLCIVQDSLDDWAAESAKMQFVYQNTYLNLAAAVSPNPSGGLFFPRCPLSFVPWAISLSGSQILQGSLVDLLEEKQRFILDTRGWTLQEQILAPRTVMFGKNELYWECRMGYARECFPDLLKPSFDPARLLTMGAFRRPLESMEWPPISDFQRQQIWRYLVEQYSGRELTRQSDKLVAISGLAQAVGSRWEGSTYHAGLWSYYFRQNLLWECQGINGYRARNTHAAPSWSWASLSAKCSLPEQFAEIHVDSLANVSKVIVTPLQLSHPFGQVSGGVVRLEGPLLQATVQSTQAGWQLVMDETGAARPATTDPRIPLLGAMSVPWVSWDDDETRECAEIQPMQVYLAPLQVEIWPWYPLLQVSGLLLKPASTSPQKGRFARLGVFNIRQNISISAMNRLSVGKEAMFYTPNNTKLKHRYSPVLEPGEDQDIGHFLEKLKLRYSSQELHEGENHEVVHFLICLELAAQRNRESDKPDENLHHVKPSGFYIYELVSIARQPDQDAQQWEATKLSLFLISAPSILVDFCSPGTLSNSVEVLLGPCSPTILRRFRNSLFECSLVPLRDPFPPTRCNLILSYLQATIISAPLPCQITSKQNSSPLSHTSSDYTYKMEANMNNNRHQNRNRNRNRRRNRRGARNPALRGNRDPVHAAGGRVENQGHAGPENRALPAPPAPPPLDPRFLEGWENADLANPALAEAPPAPFEPENIPIIDHSIQVEAQAETIRQQIALAVQSFGPSCLFWVRAGPIRGALGQDWTDAHHVTSHGDHELARMTVELAVHKWGPRAQISLTARPAPLGAAPVPAAPAPAPGFFGAYPPPHHY